MEDEMPRRKSTVEDDENATLEEMTNLVTEFCEMIEDGTLDLWLEQVDISIEKRNDRYRKEQRADRSKSHAAIAKDTPGTPSRVKSLNRSEGVSEPVTRTRTRKPTTNDVPEVKPTGNTYTTGDLFYLGETAVVLEFVGVSSKSPTKANVKVHEKTPEELQDRYPVGKRVAVPLEKLQPKPIRGRGRTVKH
jgi:hypothetical protein